MTGAGDARLHRLLGGEPLAGLRNRLRRRFERVASETELREIRLAGLTPQEHAALASLLGRPQRLATSFSIDVERLDTILRQAGIADSLRDALERLEGPIVDRASARRQAEARWSEVVAACGHPDLQALLRLSSGLGLLKRLSAQAPDTAARLCRRAAAVLTCLPVRGQPRSQLAAEQLGDAHALDDGQPVATLVLSVRRRLQPRLTEDDADPPDGTESAMRINSERTRDVWAAAGVMVNELARPTLVLNLPQGSATPSPGEPTYLSLRLLLRAPPSWDVRGRSVHVCENPNIVAIAADRLGDRCAPLVCTEGMPAAAQRILLAQLAAAGARLLYHGDFDWPGLRIANRIVLEHGAVPWRFESADYVAALQATKGERHALDGQPVAAAWDPGLTDLMQEHRVAIAEESIVEPLLQDLLSDGAAVLPYSP